MLKIGWILITILNAIVFNLLIINYKISKIPSYLYGFLFVLVSILFIETINIWPLLISTFCIILAYGEIITLNKLDNPKGKILKSGFFIGITGLIDYNLYIFSLMNLIGLTYGKQLTWRNTVILIVGLLWPLVLIFTINHLYPVLFIESPPYKLLNTTKINLAQHYISICIICLILILSIHELYKNMYKKTEISKKAFIILILMSIIIIFTAIITKSLAIIYFLSIPLSLIITNYLLYTKHRYFRTFLLGLLLVSILFEFFYL